VLWLLYDELSGKTTKQPSIHQKVAQCRVGLWQLKFVDRVSGVFEDSATRIRPRNETFELLERQSPETGNVVLVGDAVHLDVVPQRTPRYWFSWLGAVLAVVVVEVIEVVNHAVDHAVHILLQLDLAFGAFFEHPRTGALEVLGLRCYEAAVDAVLFAVAKNGEVREPTVFEKAICMIVSVYSVISDSKVDYLCATVWKSSFARVVAMSSVGVENVAGSVGVSARHLSERGKFFSSKNGRNSRKEGATDERAKPSESANLTLCSPQYVPSCVNTYKGQSL